MNCPKNIQIYTLDVDQESLHFSKENFITNDKQIILKCSSKKLKKLIVNDHKNIYGLDVSECDNLEYLDCKSNDLKDLKINENLKFLDCSYNNIKELYINYPLNKIIFYKEFKSTISILFLPVKKNSIIKYNINLKVKTIDIQEQISKNITCPICLDNYKQNLIQTICCKRYFHSTCILNKKIKSCCLCRNKNYLYINEL